MKNKMFIIIGVIVVLFAALYFLTNYQNKKTVDEHDNPYVDKDISELHQETIDLIGDPNYGNIIIPDELDEKLANGEDVTVYFFSPTCVYCQQATPVVAPLADELGVDMKKVNLLEYDKMDYYGLEGTPSLVHYENGEEVGRIVGLPENPEEDYRAFFEQYVLSE